MAADELNWCNEIAAMVTRATGVRFGDTRQAMLEARLLRRIGQLQLSGPQEYLQYARTNASTELTYLVTLLTSHYTFFFREYHHFQFLNERALAEIVARVVASGRKTIRVWSAACSQGQEVYSLAMCILDYLTANGIDLKLDILGTDVDVDSICTAQNGVYRWKQVEEIPLQQLNTYWVRGRAELSDFVRATDRLRDVSRFEVDNLLELTHRQIAQKFDMIFCRNVLIYFEPQQVHSVIGALAARLYDHGYLFLGASESALGQSTILRSVAPSIYTQAVQPRLTPITRPSRYRPRVLCVDDSAVILRMLERILCADFDIVGTASNGLEAGALVKQLKPDLITLDIHMPVQTGVEFLERNTEQGLPPVVVISSVTREDSGLALRCLELGASDYIEKPTMMTLEWRADEIRAKLHSVLLSSRPASSTHLAKADSALRSISLDSLRVLLGSPADWVAIQELVAELRPLTAPLVIALDGAAGILPSLSERIAGSHGIHIDRLERVLTERAAAVAIVDLSDLLKELSARHAGSDRIDIFSLCRIVPGFLAWFSKAPAAFLYADSQYLNQLGVQSDLRQRVSCLSRRSVIDCLRSGVVGRVA